MSRFIGTVPNREKVAMAYALRDQDGMTRRRIAEIVGANKDTVTRWLNMPDLYDPQDDEVAIARAMAGDKAVYDRLTVFEYREVIRRLALVSMELDPADWSDYRQALIERLGERTFRSLERRVQDVRSSFKQA